MTGPTITLTPLTGEWVISAKGIELARATSAISLKEGGYPDVLYFPPEVFAGIELIQTDHRTKCPWKGVATYFSMTLGDGTLENRIWCYQYPLSTVSQIKGYLGLYPEFDVIQTV